jgi:hypothetical protein
MLGCCEYSSESAGSLKGGLRLSASQKRLSSWTYRNDTIMVCDSLIYYIRTNVHFPLF